MSEDQSAITLSDIRRCFTGVIPVVIATASGRGIPNVTFVSRVHPVDDERIPLSNQFMSKSKRNLVENPSASLLMVDPDTFNEYRVSMTFERTERHGPIFDRLRNDIALVAALQGMESVFRLQTADIFRVTHIEEVRVNDIEPLEVSRSNAGGDPAPLSELCGRISRCADIDTLVRVTVDGMAELLGYQHSSLLLLDEHGTSLFTIASHGYDEQGVGSEIAVGEGVAGMAAARCEPMRVGTLTQMAKYARSVRHSYEASGGITPGSFVAVPGIAGVESRIAVPALSLGQLVGVLTAESRERDAYDHNDVANLTIIASLVANAMETHRLEAGNALPAAPKETTELPKMEEQPISVRFFPEDGSTFLDGDYVIRGVAGRILWCLLSEFNRYGRIEFSNREVRLDPSLDLPDFRDNFESRLILLKRRLEERDACVQLEKTGRGRFRINVSRVLELEEMK